MCNCLDLVRARAQYSAKDQTLRVPMAQADQPQPLSPTAIAVSVGQPKSVHFNWRWFGKHIEPRKDIILQNIDNKR